MRGGRGWRKGGKAKEREGERTGTFLKPL